MSKLVKLLIEQYISSTEQMDEVMKNISSASKKYEKEKESRHNFLMSVLGKPLYNKILKNGNMESFAPIPLSAIIIHEDDFIKAGKDNGKTISEDDAHNIASLVNSSYKRNLFTFRNKTLSTDIVFQSVDDVIDFFNVLIRSFLKITKTPLKLLNNFSIKPIVLKFRKYFD